MFCIGWNVPVLEVISPERTAKYRFPKISPPSKFVNAQAGNDELVNLKGSGRRSSIRCWLQLNLCSSSQVVEQAGGDPFWIH